MHQLTETLAAKVAIAVNSADVAPIQIVADEPIRLVCPFASTGRKPFDLAMAAAIADDYLATQPCWVCVIAVEFADGRTVYHADFTRYNAWTSAL